MRLLARLDTRSTKKAKPLTRALIEKLLDHETASLTGQRDAALEAVQSHKGFRGASTVSMRLEDVHFEKLGVRIGLRDEKTSKDRELHYTGIRHQKSHHNCAPCLLKTYVERLPFDSGPIFRAIDRWGNISARALSPRSITFLLRKNLMRAQVPDAKQFSSHSYRHWVVRRGLALGWSLHDIMLVTGHRSLRGLREYIAEIDPWYGVPSGSVLDSPVSESLEQTGWEHEPCS